MTGVTKEIQKNQQRETWLDALKGLAILCVILGHSIERMQTGTGYINAPLHFLDVFVNRMHIYVFFMVGGYLYAKLDRQRLQSNAGYSAGYLKKHFFDYMLPYLFFAVLIWIGKTIFSAYVVRTVSLSDLLLMLVRPVAFMWFLYVLFVICMMVMILDRVSHFNDKILISAGLLFIMLYLVFLPEEVVIRKTLQNFLPFVAGILIYDHMEILGHKILNAASGIAGVILCVACYVFENRQCIHILDALHSIIVPYVLFSVFFHFRHCRFAVLGRLGKESLYLYIIHPVAANFVRMIFIRNGIENIWIWMLCLLAAGIGIPYLFALMAKRCVILECVFKPRKYIESYQKGKQTYDDKIGAAGRKK